MQRRHHEGCAEDSCLAPTVVEKPPLETRIRHFSQPSSHPPVVDDGSEADVKQFRQSPRHRGRCSVSRGPLYYNEVLAGLRHILEEELNMTDGSLAGIEVGHAWERLQRREGRYASHPVTHTLSLRLCLCIRIWIWICLCLCRLCLCVFVFFVFFSSVFVFVYAKMTSPLTLTCSLLWMHTGHFQCRGFRTRGCLWWNVSYTCRSIECHPDTKLQIRSFLLWSFFHHRPS